MVRCHHRLMEINLPSEFIESIKGDYGEAQAQRLISLINLPTPTTIRVNPLKLSISDNNANGTIADTLSLSFSKDEESNRALRSITKYGYLLDSRPIFTLDPLFHVGAYYVQEASSMSIEKCLPYFMDLISESVDGKVRILDLCAAPGGKSTHLLSMFANQRGVMLVANEVIRSRATILGENLTKWGGANVVVTNNDPSDFRALDSFFDLVVVDAPCSGEGMFRKDPAAISEWSMDNVEQCAARQRRILSDIWSSLREGGLLLYSTCTYNKKENSENLDWISRELGAELLYREQCFPGESFGEGFFFGLLKKRGSALHSSVAAQKGALKSGSIRSIKQYKEKLDFVKPNYLLYTRGDKSQLIKGYPEDVVEDMIYAESRLRTISGGVAVASVIDGGRGRTYIPEGDVALSESLNRGVFPEVELLKGESGHESEDALKYLRKENLTFPTSERGYLLLTYKSIPVGFVKNLGNRSNNLWNTNWRIRTL